MYVFFFKFTRVLFNNILDFCEHILFYSKKRGTFLRCKHFMNLQIFTFHGIPEESQDLGTEEMDQ